VFSLQSNGDRKRGGLRAKILDVVEEMTVPLGFAPSLRLVGLMDEEVPGEVGEQLLVALREALSNAARHAGASSVDVTVDCGGDLALRVRDNGRGMGATTRRSGLANLAARAGELGGGLRERRGE